MKFARIDTYPVRIPYLLPEISSIIDREGIIDVVVKRTADNGMVGWGESTRVADVAGVESAILSMIPFALGRDPWDREAIARDGFRDGGWSFQPMTGNFSHAAIDMALWDLCGKSCGHGQPAGRDGGSEG